MVLSQWVEKESQSIDKVYGGKAAKRAKSSIKSKVRQTTNRVRDLLGV